MTMIIVTQDNTILNSNFVVLYRVVKATDSELLDPTHQNFGQDQKTLENAGFEFSHTDQWNKNMYIRRFHRFNAIMVDDTEAIYEGTESACDKFRNTLISSFSQGQPILDVPKLIIGWGLDVQPSFELLRDKPKKSGKGDDDIPF